MGRGTPRTIAAQASGIALSTFYRWLADEPDFKERIKEAESRWADSLLTKAMEHVLGDDQRVSADMLKWLLERRAFQFFARKEVVKLGRNGDADDDGGLEITATNMESAEVSAARVAQIVRLLADAGVGEDSGGTGGGTDSEDDEVHPAYANGHATGIPAGPES